MALSGRQPLSQRDREALERIAAVHEADAIERGLAAARERLHMDAAYVTTVGSASQLVSQISGDSAALGLAKGSEIPLENTYCNRMLNGDIPNVVPNTAVESTLRDLAATSHIGAYVGVPITLTDGSVHGTLCAASSEPRSQLGNEELAFMRVLADIVAARIERSRSQPGGPTGGSTT